MAEVQAVAKRIRVSPQKMRLIVDLIRGRRVEEAMAILRYLPSPHAKDVYKVVKSAAANAENNNLMDPDELVIVRAFVDEGPTMKRFRARSRGRVSPILKRSSHVTVVVDERRGA
ncbi:MAG: 50S ribosomal protein L22 [Dehalococcoidia bacterium]